jgi:hypothetical protein
MKTFLKILRIILITLLFFLAVTAILGGIALMANFYTPPVEYLQGSIFTSFTLPGLALAGVVGGSALLAAILFLRKSQYAIMLAATAGIVIMFFEFMEVLIIGSPAGASRAMQIIYFGLGTAIEVASMGIWFLNIKGQSARAVS